MPQIGKAGKTGRIGKKGKRTGWIGRTKSTVGSSLTTGQDRSMSEYPTTTTT